MVALGNRGVTPRPTHNGFSPIASALSFAPTGGGTFLPM